MSQNARLLLFYYYDAITFYNTTACKDLKIFHGNMRETQYRCENGASLSCLCMVLPLLDRIKITQSVSFLVEYLKKKITDELVKYSS